MSRNSGQFKPGIGGVSSRDWVKYEYLTACPQSGPSGDNQGPRGAPTMIPRIMFVVLASLTLIVLIWMEQSRAAEKEQFRLYF
jgi:hypothetical protein